MIVRDATTPIETAAPRESWLIPRKPNSSETREHMADSLHNSGFQTAMSVLSHL